MAWLPKITVIRSRRVGERDVVAIGPRERLLVSFSSFHLMARLDVSLCFASCLGQQASLIPVASR